MSKPAAGLAMLLLLAALGTALAAYFIDKKAYKEACEKAPGADTTDVDKRKKTAKILNIVALSSTGLAVLVLAAVTFKKEATAETKA